MKATGTGAAVEIEVREIGVGIVTADEIAEAPETEIAETGVQGMMAATWIFLMTQGWIIVMTAGTTALVGSEVETGTEIDPDVTMMMKGIDPKTMMIGIGQVIEKEKDG